ncbi:MAG: hypothetical protein K2Y37_12420 [Pirellulales bacterium]|nr:hypothetical protein [Pirellulales bacterium]
MSWYAHVILIRWNQPRPPQQVVDEFQWPIVDSGNVVGFEDATSSMDTIGFPIGASGDWTIICDPTFRFVRPDRGKGLWIPKIAAALRKVSAGGALVFGVLLEGSTDTHGFAVCSGGKLTRFWLRQQERVVTNRGTPLAAERGLFADELQGDAERAVLRLMEEVCLPMERLDEVEFHVFHVPPPPEPTIDDLIAQLDGPDWRQAANAAWHLSRERIQPERVIPGLMKLLKCDDADARSIVAACFGDYGAQAENAVPALIVALSDEGRGFFQEKKASFPVRFRAAFSLVRIDPTRPEVIPVLREAIHYRKLDYARSEAFGMIRLLGPRAAELTPDLLKLAAGKDRHGRVRAQVALHLIDSTYEVTDDVAKNTLSLLAEYGLEPGPVPVSPSNAVGEKAT